jgi:hypothetical protein
MAASVRLPATVEALAKALASNKAYPIAECAAELLAALKPPAQAAAAATSTAGAAGERKGSAT